MTQKFGTLSWVWQINETGEGMRVICIWKISGGCCVELLHLLGQHLLHFCCRNKCPPIALPHWLPAS